MALYPKEPLLSEIEQLKTEIKLLEQERDFQLELAQTRDQVGKIPIPPIRKLKRKPSELMIHRIGFYDKEKLRKLPDFEQIWKHSYYYKHQVECENLIDGCLQPDYLQEQLRINEKNPFCEGEYRFLHMNMVCLLETVIPTQNGCQMIFRDPYDSFLTEEITDESIIQEAKTAIGYVCLVKTAMLKGKPLAKLLELKKLPHTLLDGQP